VLALIAVLYGLGIVWLRRLAKFESPQRMLGDAAPEGADAEGAPAGSAAGSRKAAAHVAGSRA
jgi:hypothetical protein